MKRFDFYKIGMMVILLVMVTASSTVWAVTKTFPAGSYIIPQDICWQPNKDPKTVEICANGKDDDLDGTIDEANTVALPYNCYVTTGCDTDQNDMGFFQAIGLVYDLLKNGYPIYWVINPAKTNAIGLDFSIAKSGTDPAVAITHSLSKANSGTLTPVEYRGGPFVVDVNDYDTDMQALFDKYAKVKIHQANYDFSAPVDKVLSGEPPHVAVLGEGSTQVLTDYLFASGLGNFSPGVFEYVNSSQIKAGILSDYQLVWAPHWIVDKEVPVAADRPIVLGKIRSFLEAGNAGFFECASLESLERSINTSSALTPAVDIPGEGLLLDKNYTAAARLQANNGSQSSKMMVFESPTHVLTQCGGWRYESASGHVDSFRPNQLPNPDYVYNATVERFIHDDDVKATAYGAPMGYDYYVGGRVNGVATQGYVAYLAGHKYVKCMTANTAESKQHNFDLQFNASLLTSGTVYVEVGYSGCVLGSTCPKASYDLTTLSGTSASDQTAADKGLSVDLDSAEFTPVYDIDGVTVLHYVLKNVIVNNKDTLATHDITSLVVTFSGNPPTTLLTKIVDQTDAAAPVTVCSPNSPTPASCPSLAYRYYDLVFTSALVSGTSATVEVVYGTCTSGTNCPTALFTVGGGKASGGDGTISIDMSGASWDATAKTLKRVGLANLTATAKTLVRFNVTFAGNGATKLVQVNDVTTTSSQVCASNLTSPASCPPATVTADVIVNSFRFKNDMPQVPGGMITITVGHSGCIRWSTCTSAASYFLGINSGMMSSADGKVNIDLTAASFDHGTKTLNNVKLTNLTGGPLTVTHFRVYDSLNVDLVGIWKGGTQIDNDQTDVSPAASIPLDTSEVLTLTTQTLGISLAALPSALNIKLGKALTECDVDWGSANSCGMKYVLNTLVGLQFQIIPNEYNKAGSIQDDNILFKGTFEYPGYKGHLYAIDMADSTAMTLWDAGKSSTMPVAGTSGMPLLPTKANASRYIFTNQPGTTSIIRFASGYIGSSWYETNTLWHYLDPTNTHTVNWALALMNSVRGRKGTSSATATLAKGTAEMSKRLGGIEHSSPAVMGWSSRIADKNGLIWSKANDSTYVKRDRVVFTGGDDGMLHAFYAGTWDKTLHEGKGGYNAGTGKEIWAYIPSTLLGTLQKQTFTDCNPGMLIDDCDPATDPDKCVCPIFSVAVSVDGSPALGDFFVDHDNNAATPKQFRTILVATAKILTPGSVAAASVNQGIIFAMDVTDPYNPKLLWERTYNAAVDTSNAPGKSIGRNYYPASVFPAAYKTGENSSFDPNMGDAKGVAIGRVQVGTTIDTYVFATSRWVRQVDTSTAPSPAHKVWGVSVYALDFYSGDIRWETKLAYTGDAEGVNEPLATPSLLDYGDNGTADYVVFGDMQGRLWVLRSTDGTSIMTDSGPAYTVGAGPGPGAVSGATGAAEPIGAPVAISGTNIIFGTGGRDSLADEDNTYYHVIAIDINNKGEVVERWKYQLPEKGEKIWAAPVVDANGTVFIGTAIGYSDIGKPDELKLLNRGELIILDLATGAYKKDAAGNAITPIKLKGAVIGDISIQGGQVVVTTLNGEVYQFGNKPDAPGGKFSFESTGIPGNPVKTLWWRKL